MFSHRFIDFSRRSQKKYPQKWRICQFVRKTNSPYMVNFKNQIHTICDFEIVSRTATGFFWTPIYVFQRSKR
jgi:hypothetical protein